MMFDEEMFCLFHYVVYVVQPFPSILSYSILFPHSVAALNSAGVGAYIALDKHVAIEVPVTGEKPRVIGGMDDVIVMSPDVGTMQCQMKPGMEDAIITWYVEYNCRFTEKISTVEINIPKTKALIADLFC